MAFIDNLGFELDSLILVTAIVFYTGVWIWWHHSRHESGPAVQHLRGGAVLLGILGGFLTLLGFWGEFTWPLPASYNLLFYDPTILVGILLLGFTATVWTNVPTQYVGVVGVVAGAGVIYYGARAYLLGLTTEPLEMFLMFLAFGALGVLSYPATLFLDLYVTPAAHGTTAAPIGTIWKLALAVFLAMAVLAGVAAILMGFNTVWSHLAKAP